MKKVLFTVLATLFAPIVAPAQPAVSSKTAEITRAEGDVYLDRQRVQQPGLMDLTGKDDSESSNRTRIMPLGTNPANRAAA